MKASIHEQIKIILEKNGDDYLSVQKIIDRLPANTLKRLHIKKAAKQESQISKVGKLRPYLSNTLKVYKNSMGTQFIGYSLTDSELICRTLRKHPDISSKKLHRRLPMIKAEYMKALSDLLDSQTVYCTAVYSSHIVAGLRVSNGKTVLDPVQPLSQRENSRFSEQERMRLFHNAYHQIGSGRPYVMIYKLRYHLNWPKEVFDETLVKLSKSTTIELQGGDSSRLTPAEIADSYEDALGYLMLSLSWRGEK